MYNSYVSELGKRGLFGDGKIANFRRRGSYLSQVYILNGQVGENHLQMFLQRLNY